MKIFITELIALFLPFTVHFAYASADGKAKSSKAYNNPIGGHPKPRFISFNSEDGQIDIDWDVTIPFISIPLNHEPGENGEVSPLFNVNTKALGIAGLVTTILTLVVPLFSKPTPEMHYRSGDGMQWPDLGNTLNDMIFGNNYVAPCMQRIVCSVVSIASNAANPTSTDKIIDGLSSHKWFKDATNGTIIQDAVMMGREGNPDCSHVFKDCLITPRILKAILSQFGI